MAHGIACKYCGYQEMNHNHLKEAETEEQRRKIVRDLGAEGALDGYERRLIDCSEYIPEDWKAHEEADQERRDRHEYRWYDGQRRPEEY